MGAGGGEEEKRERSDEPFGLHLCPARAGNSGPHGGHAAPWGGRAIRAGTPTSCSSAFAGSMLTCLGGFLVLYLL